jgi:hypothetical protein
MPPREAPGNGDRPCGRLRSDGLTPTASPAGAPVGGANDRTGQIAGLELAVVLGALVIGATAWLNRCRRPL